MSLRGRKLSGGMAAAVLVACACAAADDNPWKPTSESLDELVHDGFTIIDTNVVVPPTGTGVTVEVIYLRRENDVFRCLTRHVEGSEGARHRCDELK